MPQSERNSRTADAQTLRKYMTPEERALWYDFLKKLPVTVRRQKVLGRYIVDFYCATARLVIELDGSQHEEPQHKAEDEERDAYLRSRGLTVLRYSNWLIKTNFEGVCQDIWEHIAPSSASVCELGYLPPEGEGCAK